MTENINCPICGENKEIRLLFHTKSKKVVEHLIIENQIDQKIVLSKIEQLWQQKTASFLQCNSCSFEFSDPFLSADSDLYSIIYKSTHSYLVEKWEYNISKEAIVNFIKYSNNIPRLLEIGAGNGSFLKKIVNTIIPAKDIYATEFSENGAKEINNSGIQCFSKNINALNKEDLNGSVNIICLFQVLEHITEIHEFFLKLNELCSSTARLYISVPNIYNRQFLDKFGYHLDLPPIHVGRYNKKSLKKLASQYGWDVIKNKIQPSTFNERAFKFIIWRYSKLPFTIENMKYRIFKLFLRYIILSLIVLLNIQVILGFLNSKLGTAQWFELERIK